ncbi:MAG TPA: hypothetical protein VFQ85_06605 [Mycobacteriales bacterium]|jgi:hypothetical protein|nr:hypothetical protein [Mycobacteriales bacterium]
MKIMRCLAVAATAVAVALGTAPAAHAAGGGGPIIQVHCFYGCVCVYPVIGGDEGHVCE